MGLILTVAGISLYFILNPRYSTIVMPSKDSVIMIYRDSIIYYEKQLIKNHYEYKIDSVIISHIPDSAYERELMLRTRYILNPDTSGLFKNDTVRSVKRD
jgi:hypothetical protein